MSMVAADTISKQNRVERADSMRYVCLMCLLLFALIVARAIYPAAIYIFVLVSLAVIICSKTSHVFAFLLFLLPFSSILRLSTSSISFYTVLHFVAILKMIFVKRYFSADVIVSVMIFVVYGIVFSGLSQLTTVATMAAGMLLVYCLQSIETKANLCIIAFTLGVLGASLLALLKDLFPALSVLLTDMMHKLGAGNYVVRFSGLQTNPNYYTMDIVVILAAFIVMMYTKQGYRSYGIFAVLLIMFGLMSVSKSFLLALILLMLLWMILSIKQGIGQVAKFLLIAAVTVAVVYFFAYEAINTYLFRLESDAGDSLDGIFTGRIGLWQAYAQQIFGNVRIFLFGNGLKTLGATKVAHNTYLESLYNLGVVGTGVFLISLKNCAGKVISRPIMWVPVAVLLFRMFAINILTYDNIWLYIGLLVVLSKALPDRTNHRVTLCEKNKENTLISNI